MGFSVLLLIESFLSFYSFRYPQPPSHCFAVNLSFRFLPFLVNSLFVINASSYKGRGCILHPTVYNILEGSEK